MLVNSHTHILDHISVQGVEGDFEMNIKLLNGHVLDMLNKIPDESVDCIVTSCPYYGLRSYKGADTIWGGNPECEHEWISQQNHKDNLRFRDPNHTASVGNNKNAEIFANPTVLSGNCSKCGAWKGQLGLEPTYQMYIDHLMLVMKELKRVLKKTGTLFWNMGDSYSSKGGSSKPEQLLKANVGATKSGEQKGIRYITGLSNNISDKSLMMIPERFAMAMIDDGWILRNTLCWFKRNAMPSSVSDRFSNKWEYVFFFTKSQKYFFDLDSVRKPLKESSIKRRKYPMDTINWKTRHKDSGIRVLLEPGFSNSTKRTKHDEAVQRSGSYDDPLHTHPNHPNGANPGDVIEPETVEFFRQKGQGGNFDYSGINSESGSHYNQHGVNPGDVSYDESPYDLFTDPNIQSAFFEYLERERPELLMSSILDIPIRSHSFDHFAVFPITLVEPLIKAGCPSNGTVLDPFAGSGTVGVVAMKQEKNAILVEISPEYCNIIKKRLNWGVGLDVEYEHTVGGF